VDFLGNPALSRFSQCRVLVIIVDSTTGGLRPMSVNVGGKIDSIISDLEAKLSRWKTIRDAVGDDAVREELTLLLAGEGVSQVAQKSNGKVKKKSGKRSKILEALQAYFAARGNEWATLVEIIEKSGLSKSSARQVLYISHASYFDRQSSRTGDRQTKFRLKDSAS
jgi:hypothetical protein